MGLKFKKVRTEPVGSITNEVQFFNNTLRRTIWVGDNSGTPVKVGDSRFIVNQHMIDPQVGNKIYLLYTPFTVALLGGQLVTNIPGSDVRVQFYEDADIDTGGPTPLEVLNVTSSGSPNNGVALNDTYIIDSNKWVWFEIIDVPSPTELLTVSLVFSYV